MASEWESAYEQARRLHQAGQLNEALVHYHHVIGLNPGHGGAMHMLGLIAYQIGRTDTAVDLLGQAAVLEPLVGAVHSNYGLALMARGRRKEAEASFRRALLLGPQPETHASLGQLLLEQGRLEEALAGFRAASQRNPSLAVAHAGAGETLWKLGRLPEAEFAYERAAAAEPTADTLAHHAMLIFAGGRGAVAMDRIREALALEITPQARKAFTAIVSAMRPTRDDAGLRALLTRALAEDWSRPAALLPAAAALVKLGLKAGGRPETDALLQLMLTVAANTDLELERMLTEMRRQLLAQTEGRDLAFTAALAQQCFLNDYVFAEEPGERDRAQTMAAAIETALAEGDVISATALMAVACYIPLHTLKGADGLLLRGWPDPLEPLLRQQVAEPLEEAPIVVPQLTPIAGAVTGKVQAMYEENPYPHWARMEKGDTPSTLAAYLGKHFPNFAAAKLPLLPDMLFAGCGTGLFLLELAQDHPAASRLAVDLSRASLAYAARKAEETGITVEFAQADILRLPETGRRFSAIESSGVLHHMASPFEGWRALLACLLPGGVMRVSLYSALARRPVAEARTWIAAQGLSATPEGIRAARQRLIADRPAEARAFLNSPDFFSVSACRDLLFHVEEHGMSLAEIGAFLAENNLAFLGFELADDVLGAYRARFPADPGAADLDNWAVFEAEHPTLFAGMYQFWIQKP